MKKILYYCLVLLWCSSPAYGLDVHGQAWDLKDGTITPGVDANNLDLSGFDIVSGFTITETDPIANAALANYTGRGFISGTTFGDYTSSNNASVESKLPKATFDGYTGGVNAETLDNLDSSYFASDSTLANYTTANNAAVGLKLDKSIYDNYTGQVNAETLDNLDSTYFAVQSEFGNHTGNIAIHFTEGSIDHNNILNKGTNTHAVLDTAKSAFDNHTGTPVHRGYFTNISSSGSMQVGTTLDVNGSSVFNGISTTSINSGAVDAAITDKWINSTGDTGVGSFTFSLYSTLSNTFRVKADGTGSFVLDGVGGSRGANSVDLQTARTLGGRIASGATSSVLGGEDNRASGDWSTVSGGWDNQATGDSSVVCGGGWSVGNVASNVGSTACGGDNNLASGQYSFIGGGLQGTASGDYSFVAGGSQNIASGSASSVLGGGLGTGNTASATTSTVAGGNNNTASGASSFVGGGDGNTAAGDYSAIFGREGNINASADRSSGFIYGTTDQNITLPDVHVIYGASGFEKKVGIQDLTPHVELSVNGTGVFGNMSVINTFTAKGKQSVKVDVIVSPGATLGAHNTVFMNATSSALTITMPDCSASTIGDFYDLKAISVVGLITLGRVDANDYLEFVQANYTGYDTLGESNRWYCGQVDQWYRMD